MKNYIIDDMGNKKAIIIDIEEFNKLIEYLEEIEDALDLKKAIEEGNEFIEIREFLKELQQERKL